MTEHGVQSRQQKEHGDNKKNKNKKNNVNHIAVILLSVVTVLFSAASSDLSTVSMLCMTAAAAFFACLLFMTNYLIIFAVGVASFVSALYIGNEIFAIILGLSYIPVGLIIFTGMAKKCTRTQITVRITAFTVIFYSALIILYFFLAQGTFNLNMLSSAVDDQLTAVLNGADDYMNQMTSILSQENADAVPEAPEISETARQEFMMNMKMLVPSVFVLYCMFIAYLSTSVFRIFYNIFYAKPKSKEKEIKKLDWRIALSPVSAVIMIISAAVPIVFYDRYNLLPWIVSTNLEYILVPGFCIMGIYFIYDKIYNLYNSASYHRYRRKGTVPAVGLAFGLIFLFTYLTAYVLAVLTIFGLYAAVIGNIKNFYGKAKKFITGGGDDNNDNNDNDDGDDDDW